MRERRRTREQRVADRLARAERARRQGRDREKAAVLAADERQAEAARFWRSLGVRDLPALIEAGSYGAVPRA